MAATTTELEKLQSEINQASGKDSKHGRHIAFAQVEKAISEQVEALGEKDGH